MKNYKKTIALHGRSSFTKVCENADATASVLTEAVYVPHFFKINGEYVDFDLMNLELNTGTRCCFGFSKTAEIKAPYKI